MEKIQQALEKARRTRVGDARPQPVQGRPVVRQRPHPNADRDELRVDYQRTRVVRVDPEVLRQNRVVAAGRDDEPGSEAFRILRTQVLARLEARGGNAVAVCSGVQAEGKTLVAVNLAVSVARQLHRTALLVDLDIHRPSIHRCFGLNPTLGLMDHLAGRAPLEDCLVNPGIERLVLLPQTGPASEASELLTSRRMAALAAELKTRYRDRIVVYDCPPLLATNDALVIMDYADGCLLVVREGRLQRAELQRAVDLVGPENYLGVVLNDARYAEGARYYHYHYGRGRDTTTTERPRPQEG